ncbi:hypothetical protein B0H13DRAFT_2332557 [Mycena leptocephala]|nr:hypothetical protein B0H13DRAFT_2332557 [Mycena leptocephala]
METLGPAALVLKNLKLNWTQITQMDLFLIPIPTFDECLHILKEGVSLRRCSLNAACVLISHDLEVLFLLKLEHFQLTLYSGVDGSPQSEFLVFQSLSISWNAAQGPLWSKSSCDTFIELGAVRHRVQNAIVGHGVQNDIGMGLKMPLWGMGFKMPL